MASSSSSSIAPSPVSRYDVFLSFRGEDTRNSFTDHLYDALVRAGLRTFRDDDEIERGEELKLAILRAIKTSEASIVVLSPNYADSTWCLDELWLILNERRARNHFVLPVFYHVCPSDVRKQSMDLMIEVKPYERWTLYDVNRWKAALTEVADLAGLVLSGRETVFLKKIVDTIYNKLGNKNVHLLPNLIGIDAQVKEINSLLLVCGMGAGYRTSAYPTNARLQYPLSVAFPWGIGPFSGPVALDVANNHAATSSTIRETAPYSVEGFVSNYSATAAQYAVVEVKLFVEHKLFIGMLPKNVSESEASTVFSQYGTLKDLQILRGSQQTSKGCAFVTYETKEQALSSIEGLNGKHKMEGSTVPLVVKWADTEKERQARKAQKAQSLA